jgi:hypothetical protein
MTVGSKTCWFISVGSNYRPRSIGLNPINLSVHRFRAMDQMAIVLKMKVQIHSY